MANGTHTDAEGSGFHILLVEDNDDHAELFRRMLAYLELPVTLSRASDGSEALVLLRNHDGQDTPPISPDVVLLDLKLPRMDGHAVLKEIKQDPKLRHMPVIIMSTSNAPSDVRRAYDAYANGYLVKPIDPVEYRTMVRDFVMYWHNWNEPPIQ